MRVSVIVLCRDNPLELEETLSSIPPAMGSTPLGDLEVLVVDGSSSSDCRLQVEAFRRRHPELDIRCRPLRPRGIYDAMNRALALAGGEWIGFMNAGDVYEHNGLAQLRRHAKAQLGLLGPERAVAVFGQAWVDPAAGAGRPWLTPDPRMRRLRRWLRFMVPCHQAFLFAAAFARSHPYAIDGGITADRPVMRAALARAGEESYLPIPVCRFRLGGLSSREGVKPLLSVWPSLLPWMMRHRAQWIGRTC